MSTPLGATLASIRAQLHTLSLPVATLLVLAALVVLGLRAAGAAAVATAFAVALLLLLAVEIAGRLELLGAASAGTTPLSTYAQTASGWLRGGRV